MKRSLLLTLALAVVMGVVYATLRLAPESLEGALDAFGERIESTPEGLRGSAGAAGLLLLGAWMFGLLASRASLPKISGYLIFGTIVGPSALAIVTKTQLGQLQFINDLAISLIALTAGGEIRLRMVRKSIKVISLVTGLQVGLIFGAVTGLVYFGFETLGLKAVEDSGARLALAAIVGAIASASSPAAAIAVISEMRAHGRMAQLSLSAAVSKDMLVVAMFAVVISLAAPALSDAGADATQGAEQPAAQVDQVQGEAVEAEAPPEGAAALAAKIVRELGVSALAGCALGIGLAWLVRAMRANLPIFVVLVCFGISVLSEAAHLDALIVALVAGLMMENVFQTRTAAIFDTLEELSLPVFCVFFAVAGAKIDLGLLASLWPAALAIVGVRAGMIWLSSFLGTRLAGERGPAGRWLWTAFIPQAGVSLALAALVARTFEGLDVVDQVYSLLLAAIAIHELAGPVLMKIGLSRGDVEEASEPLEEGDISSRGGGH